MSDIEKLWNDDLYQVFLFACPAHLPFFFAIHPWFVVNMRGPVSRFGVGRNGARERYEVVFETGKSAESYGHLHKNLFPPFQGIPVFPFSTKFFWRPRLLSYIEGGESSSAQQMAETIAHSGETYPHRDSYSVIGANSNTYVQWILDQFSESRMRLPWNAFGKNFGK